MGRAKKNGPLRWILVITFWTFILAVAIGFITQYLMSTLFSLVIAFLILSAVIVLGIIFDLIGTAAAAADIAPLNAKAARKVPGARQGVYLVQNAEKVANFFNDVVGDISGIVSGTLAAIIVLRLVVNWSRSWAELYVSILLTALVAALTVGGKAWGKDVAINRSTEVILFVGKIIMHLEKPLHWFSRKHG